MLLYENKKDIEKVLKNIGYKDIKNASVSVFIYNGSGNSVKYEINANITLKSADNSEKYNENDYLYFRLENQRIGGCGYDRWSTALSNGLNLFKNLYKIKTTLVKKSTYGSYKEFYTKEGRRVYGLSDDASISYGIGVDSVLSCVGLGFSNVNYNTKRSYQGRHEDLFVFEIKGK